ncbi:uncharacterized protein LOC142346202 isoform X3 [Convolutriloba macropyga]|uniref:uncharacterized protein LOC142346202 isoform X3 n=1 Tax=Convolutriloba macropyga TaxID=536237 RepID=UPI003F521515
MSRSNLASSGSADKTSRANTADEFDQIEREMQNLLKSLQDNFTDSGNKTGMQGSGRRPELSERGSSRTRVIQKHGPIAFQRKQSAPDFKMAPITGQFTSQEEKLRNRSQENSIDELDEFRRRLELFGLNDNAVTSNQNASFQQSSHAETQSEYNFSNSGMDNSRYSEADFTGDEHSNERRYQLNERLYQPSPNSKSRTVKDRKRVNRKSRLRRNNTTPSNLFPPHSDDYRRYFESSRSSHIYEQNDDNTTTTSATSETLSLAEDGEDDTQSLSIISNNNNVWESTATVSSDDESSLNSNDTSVLNISGSRYSSRTDLTESTIQCEPKPRTNRSQSAGIFAPINYGGMHFFARAQTPEKDTVFSCIVCKQSIDGEKKQRFNDGCLEGVNEKWVHEDCMDSVCPVCNQVVFAMEEVSVEGQSYHRQCCKCTSCGRSLTTATANTAGSCISLHAQEPKSPGGPMTQFVQSGNTGVTHRRKSSWHNNAMYRNSPSTSGRTTPTSPYISSPKSGIFSSYGSRLSLAANEDGKKVLMCSFCVKSKQKRENSNGAAKDSGVRSTAGVIDRRQLWYQRRSTPELYHHDPRNVGRPSLVKQSSMPYRQMSYTSDTPPNRRSLGSVFQADIPMPLREPTTSRNGSRGLETKSASYGRVENRTEDTFDCVVCGIEIQWDESRDFFGNSSQLAHWSCIKNMCPVCSGVVHAQEGWSSHGRMYHKLCFKCCSCGSSISKGSETVKRDSRDGVRRLYHHRCITTAILKNWTTN